MDQELDPSSHTICQDLSGWDQVEDRRGRVREVESLAGDRERVDLGVEPVIE